MKRGDFFRELVDSGCCLKRHGNKHDIYANPANGKQTPIPRHSEIKDTLCQLIKSNWVYESDKPARVRITYLFGA